MSKYSDRKQAAQQNWDKALDAAEKANAGPDSALTERENRAAADYARALVGRNPKKS
jgi:hypothetical protein